MVFDMPLFSIVIVNFQLLCTYFLELAPKCSLKMNSYEKKTKLQGTFEYILVSDDELNNCEKFLSRGEFIL